MLFMICSDMSTPGAALPAAPATDAPQSADERLRVRIERQLQVLDELAAMGLEVARAVERQAKAVESEAGAQVVAAAWAKASRALRLTVLLQSRLTQQLHLL